ncbi:MAG TPA: hypothetical protein VKA45_04170 [Gaiellaceae bacterium]|nr:hypothetical protein [Gaiellaceae bacterium]
MLRTPHPDLRTPHPDGLDQLVAAIRIWVGRHEDDDLPVRPARTAA